MSHRNKHALSVAITLSLFGLSQQASAAGFALITQSASSMGNAYSGASSLAEDASTAWFNPAGLTKLKSSQLVVAGHVIASQANFTDAGSSVNPLLTGGVVAGSLHGTNDNGGTTGLVPNLYYAHPLNDELTLGFSINAPFGLGTDYEDDWVGRYHALHSGIVTVNLNPSVGWKINDKVSFGAGFNAQYIKAELSSAIDSSAVCLKAAATTPALLASCGAAGLITPSNVDTDSKAELETDNWSFGYNLGALFDVSDKTRIGITYRSEIEQSTSGTAKFTIDPSLQPILNQINAGLALSNQALLTNTDISATVSLPANASFSATHQATPKLQLLADITWTGWGSYKELRIKYDNGQADTVTVQNYQDVLRYSIGANYQYTDKLTLRTGLALDEEAILDPQLRTPRTPGNDRTWISFGAGYQISKQAHLDFGYARLFLDETAIDNTDSNGYTLRGTYKGKVDILSTQLTWNF